MKKTEQINALIDEAINSVEGIQRAVPAPFLLTRVNAQLNKTKQNIWEKASRYIGRPSVAFSGLLVLIFINVMAVVVNSPLRITATEQSVQAPADEYAYAVSTIYETENTEP